MSPSSYGGAAHGLSPIVINEAVISLNLDIGAGSISKLRGPGNF